MPILSEISGSGNGAQTCQLNINWTTAGSAKLARGHVICKILKISTTPCQITLNSGHLTPLFSRHEVDRILPALSYKSI